MKRKAFTLIELLIVIAIIVLLSLIVRAQLSTGNFFGVHSTIVRGKVIEKRTVLHGGYPAQHIIVEISPHTTVELNSKKVNDQITPGQWYNLTVVEEFSVDHVEPIPSPEER